MSLDSLSYYDEQQKSSFVENYALRNMLELSSKLGNTCMNCWPVPLSFFFFLHFCLFYCWPVPLFFFFTLLFVLFAYEVQDCLFKALGFELS